VAIPSLPSWLHELQHLWHELGFPDDSLPVWQKIGDEMETPEQLERYLTQLDSGVHSLAINHLGFEPPPVPALPSYLDLALNGHTYSVSRLGFQVIAQVEESPLRWQIVLSLVNARGRYLSLNELRDTAWPAAGLSPKVGIGTVYNEISLLRKLLAPLDIGIGCATKLGYRLEASIEPDELGS
jgi:DNA-binding winged helix-turn-helix (wHTH) protein